MKSTAKTYDLVFTALGAVLICVCSWISIPAAVPFTLQTFAVFCVLRILGGKRGTTSVLLYLLLGAIGIPVFSGFKGGIGVLFGTTGGYIIGFIFMGLIYWVMEKQFGTKTWISILSMILGLLVCYAFGTAWFMIAYARTTGAIGVMTALGWCVFPFILPDLIKMVLADRVAAVVRKQLPLAE